jgi:hypothetical protein
MELTGGARLAVTEGEGIVAGLRKLEEETSFGKYANAAQAGMGQALVRPMGGRGWGSMGGLGQEAGRAGWPLGRLGRMRRKIRLYFKFAQPDDNAFSLCHSQAGPTHQLHLSPSAG